MTWLVVSASTVAPSRKHTCNLRAVQCMDLIRLWDELMDGTSVTWIYKVQYGTYRYLLRSTVSQLLRPRMTALTRRAIPTLS